MSVPELRWLLVPPASPEFAPSGNDWRSVESRLRITLPADFKEFVSEYGAGRIDHFLWVDNPIVHGVKFNLLEEVSLAIEQLKSLRDGGDEVPYPVYPEPGGLFPWGVTDNGDTLFWTMKNNALAVVVQDDTGLEWYEFPESISSFLVNMLERIITVDCFPEDFPDRIHTFRPMAAVK